MNLKQKSYALKRIDDIQRRKLNEIKRSDYETKSVKLSPEERFKLFKKGKFEIKKSIENPFIGYNYCKDIFTFKGEVEQSFDQDKFEKAQQKVRTQADKIRDQIMLGDAEKALELIQKFEESVL